MVSARLSLKFYSFLVITFLTIMRCYSEQLLPSRYEKYFPDLQNYNTNPPNHIFFLKRDLTAPKNKSPQSTNTTPSCPNQPKKWQVSRVTKKQYELVNMLWRKTKIFVNVENNIPEQKQDNITTKIFDFIQGKSPIIFSSPSNPISQPSTPSYIEFYYMDETDGQLQKEDCVTGKCLKSNGNYLNSFTSSSNSSFVVFHIKGALLARATTRQSHSDKGLSYQSPLLKQKYSSTVIATPVFTVYSTFKINKQHKFSTVTGRSNKRVANNYSGKTKPIEDVTRKPKPIFKENKGYNSEFIVGTNRNQMRATTLYDKVKFFEIYDNNTLVPFVKKIMLKFDYNDTDDEIKIQNAHKLLFEHVDQSSHEHNEVKHSKKHILGNSSSLNGSYLYTSKRNINSKAQILNVTTERHNKTNSYLTNHGNILKSELKEYKKLYSHINKSVSWVDYPFAAVYVYETLNVYCDAASISAHWLVASAACLSRMNQSPFSDGRSPFVAYCGESWWKPERVSYVKYSAVHPSYHPSEQTRKYSYNIGVIQVVTSMMSACSEWAPVSLMSHQFAASQGGSEALALGWGLDRFYTRELPKSPLAIYKGLVYSDSCPGNSGYSEAKRAGEGGLRNVHCLSLPPYLGEDRDPVHGSLLLVGGKLIALYLQEERRRWGEQSAQYTSIWRLIPWVVEVAKEPETDSFIDEI